MTSVDIISPGILCVVNNLVKFRGRVTEIISLFVHRYNGGLSQFTVLCKRDRDRSHGDKRGWKKMDLRIERLRGR